MKIIENRKKFFVGSLIALIIGVIVIIANAAMGNGAFNYDVEFSGGLSITIDVGQNFENSDIAAIVTEFTGQNSPQVQRIQGENQVIIKMRSIEPEVRAALIQAFAERYEISPENDFTISDISPTVSGEMQRTAILALVVACGAMLVYISLRFRDIKTGGATIMALLHDALMVICLYGILRIPMNYSFIAVILTIVGYAINNNIVIFDRLRENKHVSRNTGIGELINKSISQSLTRCLFTSATTLITIICLYILGVSSIKEFALPIILGLLCGTYTAVCLSGSILYELNMAGKSR